MNKIKRSLAILLIIGLVITGMPLNMASAAENDAANDENTNITVVDDNQLDSNTATDDEQDEEAIEEDTKTTDEGTNVAESQVDSADIQLNYIYVESPKVTTPGEQNIVVSLGDASDEITNVKLNYQKDNGEIESWDSDDSVEGVFLFTKEFDETESGIYEVVSISYEVNRDIKEIKLNEIGQDVHFGVNIDVDSASENVMIVQNDGSLIEKTDANTQDEMKDDAIVTTDNSNMVQLSNNVKMAMQSQSTAKTMSSKSDEIVIVIDPGHDSDKHAGARGVNGLKEEELTLEIAKACKTELEKYSGVKVYLTRTTSACPFPNSKDNIDDIVKRVAYANSLGADAFVSIHLNSFDGSASGAEVYYYTTNVDGKALAQKIQTELSSLGLNNRGIKKGDTYAVINNAERYGFPGIIVEHAFIDNKGDVNKVLNTNAGRQKLGVADAKGIVAAFGLTKDEGRWETIDGKTYYYDKDGNQAFGPTKIAGKWYNFDSETGAMITGWAEVYGKKCYYNEEGVLQFGPQKIDGLWYNFDASGYMVIGWSEVNGKKCYYNKEGVLQFGKQNIDGEVFYFDASGYLITGWITENDKKSYYTIEGVRAYGPQKIDGLWYNFDARGYMVTGWAEVNGKKCYYNEEGLLQFGPQKIEGSWYNFDSSGYMVTGWSEVNGKKCYYNKEGVLQFGKQSINGEIYYFNNDGYLITGWVIENGKKCYYTAEGVRVYGTCKIDGLWYNFDKKGYMVTGWAEVNGKKCYYNEEGILQFGPQKINNSWYYFDKDGYMVTGWSEVNGKKCYYNEEGILQFGPQKIDNIWYYFDEDGYMVTGWAEVNGKKCYYNEEGILQFGPQKIDDRWYHFDSSGYMVTGWAEVNGKKCYYNEEGILQFGPQYIEGNWYYFDSSGYLTNETGFLIASNSNVEAEQLVEFFIKKGQTYPEYYKNHDREATSLEKFCQIYIEEANAEGINAEIAFCQSMIETGWLKFTGSVTIDKFNFAGIGAVDSNPVGGAVKFNSVREGIRAQIQHLKAYANNEPLNKPQVDPRFHLVKRGSAPYVEMLGGKWASDVYYGYKILELVKQI